MDSCSCLRTTEISYEQLIPLLDGSPGILQLCIDQSKMITNGAQFIRYSVFQGIMDAVHQYSSYCILHINKHNIFEHSNALSNIG